MFCLCSEILLPGDEGSAGSVCSLIELGLFLVPARYERIGIELESIALLLSAGPWFAVAVGILVAGWIIIFWLAVHGAKPEDRPKIIEALAKFRWRRRSGG